VTENPAEKLRTVSFFHDLSSEALELVCERMVRRRFPAGSMLFRKEEPARGVYVLVDGRVEIFRSTADGREQVLHTEVPVQSIAELPVFDGGTYPASGRTAEDSELYFLALDDFQRLYQEHPEIADALVKNLGKRLRALVNLVEKISLRSIPSRVAASLLEKAEKAGARADGGTFRLTLTQSDLANELATSRESVARALGDLRSHGIISTEGRAVTIVSLSDLEDVASGEERVHQIRPKPR
jgi:CRP/FNR family transcriptional regulator